MKRTHHYTHRYRGIWRDGARCRIEVYQPEPGDAARRPVIVCTELADNDNTSVTNVAEQLAAEVIARHFPHLLDAPAAGAQPVVWLEHYPAGGLWRGDAYDAVTFTPWRVRVEHLGGVVRRRLGEPDWRRLSRAQVAALLGGAAVE